MFPFYKITGWRPFARNLRLTTGWIEVVCGSILILIPGPAKELASVLLLFVMLGGFYTHYALNDSFERMAPSLVFGLLLICRLIILYQVSKKERKEEELMRKIYEEVKLNNPNESLNEEDEEVPEKVETIKKQAIDSKQQQQPTSKNAKKKARQNNHREKEEKRLNNLFKSLAINSHYFKLREQEKNLILRNIKNIYIFIFVCL